MSLQDNDNIPCIDDDDQGKFTIFANVLIK